MATPVLPRAIILLCEDQEELRNVLRRILEAQRYHVLVAAGGEEAVKIVENWAGPIDLLVTDVIMAGMTGLELTAALAPAHPTMKVLYMSGYSRETLTGNGVLEPGIMFLQKPFTGADLAQKVREVLERA